MAIVLRSFKLRDDCVGANSGRATAADLKRERRREVRRAKFKEAHTQCGAD